MCTYFIPHHSSLDNYKKRPEKYRTFQSHNQCTDPLTIEQANRTEAIAFINNTKQDKLHGVV